jgi:hypothetical protein
VSEQDERAYERLTGMLDSLAAEIDSNEELSLEANARHIAQMAGTSEEYAAELIKALGDAGSGSGVVPTRVQQDHAMTTPTPAPSDLVRPFRVAISDSEIADLKQRLARTRWPDPETVPDWSQGVRVENAKSLVTYWEREYDLRRFESELNRFPHFLSTIDGPRGVRVIPDAKRC